METGKRLQSIDAVRGAVMIMMALDHVRDFVHRDAMQFSPTDLARTPPLLFLTRWVTHFCAPAFLFLAGVSAFLWWQRGRSRGQLSRFLLARGAWLILLELTVMRLAYDLNFSSQPPVLLIILWVIGLCMIGMAGLLWLPLRWLAVLSLAVIGLHHLLDPLRAANFGKAAGLWNLLHEPGAFRVASQTVIVGYPLVPWIAVMTAGFCFGPVLLMDPARRRRILAAAGTAAALAFVIVRGLHVYGDPAPWSAQKTGIFTVLSFLNCTKYPPSLAFLLMTLGPMLLALAWSERARLTAVNPLIVFGRVPFFYFVLHFYAARVVAALLAWLRYGRESTAFLFQPLPSMGGPRELFPAAFGYDLWVVYAVWAAVVAALYPACRWFAGVKARRRDWWLSYL